jgi:hypothetical protein
LHPRAAVIDLRGLELRIPRNGGWSLAPSTSVHRPVGQRLTGARRAPAPPRAAADVAHSRRRLFYSHSLDLWSRIAPRRIAPCPNHGEAIVLPTASPLEITTVVPPLATDPTTVGPLATIAPGVSNPTGNA